MTSKKQRLELFLERLQAVPPARSADEALELIAKTLNAVEDEFSGVEYRPDIWQDDGRMYPPTEANRREIPERVSLRRYRSAKHNTFTGMNGSIRIEGLDGKVMLDKPGSDGRRTHELDAP